MKSKQSLIKYNFRSGASSQLELMYPSEDRNESTGKEILQFQRDKQNSIVGTPSQEELNTPTRKYRKFGITTSSS